MNEFMCILMDIAPLKPPTDEPKPEVPPVATAIVLIIIVAVAAVLIIRATKKRAANVCGAENKGEK